MPFLADIVFQSGEFFNEDGGNPWFDFFNSAFGAFIGSIATLGAVYLHFRKDRQKERKKQLQFQIEKIRYFQSLINSIIPKLQTQIGLLKEFYEALEKDPLLIPALEIRTFYELDRMVHKINQEEYYHAYLNQFNNSNETIEEFRKIYSGLDFFEANLKQVKESFQKSFQFDYERKLDLKTKGDNVTDRIGILLQNANMNNSHPEIVKCLYSTFAEYNNRNEADISDLKNLHDNLIQKVKICLVTEESTIPEVYGILIDLKNCTHIYTEIQIQNKYVAIDFKEYHDIFVKVFSEWEKVIKQLVELSSLTKD
jgi:hypothetical protein